jgi:aryl-alcohol dehydrogenase-like predicted oxidoreductase
MAPSFPQRKIGGSPVSALGLGCMGMAFPGADGSLNETASLAALTAAADMGVTFWVTSDSYGPFAGESLLGRWFRETGRRDEIFLVTKFGMKVAAGKMTTCSEPEYIQAACAASLERLGTDRIDLYMQHRVDPAVPVERAVAAMAQLRAAGKIRHLGLSECSAATLRRAHAVHPIAAAEMEYSPFALEIESPQTGFLAAARELGVAILAYSPLGRGFLTGAVRSRDDVDPRRRIFPRFSEDSFPGNLRLAQTLADMARDKGCRPSQLALAWILAQGDGECNLSDLSFRWSVCACLC